MTSNSEQLQVAPELLDADELLHLAVRDSQNGRHDDAIEKLKRGLAVQPVNAKTLFLLGAEHAEIGMIDRAIEEMNHAIKIDSKLSIAHFQLGLLYLLYKNDVERARKAWKPLDDLEGAASYVEFKTGLLCLSDSDAIKCLYHLNRGLKLNTGNPSLNREMTKIRERISQTQLGKATPGTENSSSASAKMLLDTYKTPTDLEKT